MNVSFHKAGFCLAADLPWNAFSVDLEARDGARLTICCDDLEQWWALRKVFKKSAGYFYSPSQHAPLIRDHAQADIAAEAFYREAHGTTSGALAAKEAIGRAVALAHAKEMERNA